MSQGKGNSFGTRSTLTVQEGGEKKYQYHSLPEFFKKMGSDPARLPFSLKILLENLLRYEDGVVVKRKDIEALAKWEPKRVPEDEIQFMPARVLLQDFTGVPAVADLAAMRAAIQKLGGDPSWINPHQPADLVIDHSVQVDHFGSSDALRLNAEIEFHRNSERYQFLKWGQKAFRNFRVVPPDTGIVHQVNLEFLAQVAMTGRIEGAEWVYPDTLVGTDSHTTMINGLGVLGWGVGGIEAEAALLGQPCSMLIPQVVGFELQGALPAGSTATDLVITVTQMLRKKGVVGKFVEFYGKGLASLTLADRATLANMAPEYGATIGIFPIDAVSIEYLRLTGRHSIIPRVEAYYKSQGLWYDPANDQGSRKTIYSDHLELDLKQVEPSLAGPSRPQDRVILSQVPVQFEHAVKTNHPKDTHRKAKVLNYELTHGSVVIAAITSCTNTSNPGVLMAAGALAKKAVEKGLTRKPWVKTSLAPGSKVVTDYLKEAGLLPYLETLGFHVVGYGCTTCIGNSGPLAEPIAHAITESNLDAAAVLSGNRNFEGRINPHVRANFIGSPPLVVAYALAGSMNVNLSKDPLGTGKDGKPVYLKDIWPSQEEVLQLIQKHVTSAQFKKSYADVFAGEKQWQELRIPTGDLYKWESQSTYIKEPPFFDGMRLEPEPVRDVKKARVLALLGDSVTTDHISPAGSIGKATPAGHYLLSLGIAQKEFNSYGARRGNHEVMVRGTFANIRLKNLLVPGIEGGVTHYFPKNQQMSIYDASMEYQANGIPLIVIAGKEYGTGSSRDWAAKGPKLLGIRAVIAESFERIHRSNLVGMGILPLQFQAGENAKSLGIKGDEEFDIEGMNQIEVGQKVSVTVRSLDGKTRTVALHCRIDTPNEVEYFRNGGILPYVLRQSMKHKAK